MENFTLDEIVNVLGPRDGRDLIWDILIYSSFILAFIGMAMQSAKTLAPTMMMGGVMTAALIDKLLIFDTGNLVTFLLHVVMFTIPILVTGTTKAPKSRPATALGAIVGGIYLWGFLWFEQAAVVGFGAGN